MSNTDQPLLHTPLHALHRSLGAKMVPFAGYDMPVQYPLGVLKEHLHTREQAGLFDVSHMGQIHLRGEGVAEALEQLVPVDVQGLELGQQRYALFTNEQGGILDDLMITRCADHWLLVVNAACKNQDFAHLRAHLPATVEAELLEDRALLALQGPQARAVGVRLAPELAQLVFMRAAEASMGGIPCFVSCSGYTGEDGFEISVDAARAVELAQLLLAQPEVAPIGLGARDSLRLEAGLCLYGHDMNDQATPVEAALEWSISKARKPGGTRAGGYPGAAVVERQLAAGAARRRVMLVPEGRAPVREGVEVVLADGRVVGHITSGGHSPTLNRPVAMGYVDSAALTAGSPLFASLRGKQIPLQAQRGALVPQRYVRG